TEAALAHLSELQQRFGDWRLAVMAFNAGAYRLAGALQAGSPPASPEQHAPPGLAMTTYEHLGKLLALACLVREPGRIGLELPDVAFEPLGAQQLHALASTAPHATERGAAASTKHTVRSGDSLWAIARRYGVHVRDLLRW